MMHRQLDVYIYLSVCLSCYVAYVCYCAMASLPDSNKLIWFIINYNSNVLYLAAILWFFRFWLIDCGNSAPDEMIALSSKVYSEAVAVPIVGRFVVFTRSHHETEAQLRVLCITEDFDASTTLECQENFHEIARSEPVEVKKSTNCWLEIAFLS